MNAPFVENRGQVIGTDSTAQDDVRYYTRSNYPNTYIFDDKVSFVFAHIDTVASSQDTMTRLDLNFVSELSTVAAGLERQEDFHNYYLGHIPEGRERVPLENKVLHPSIYTNIDAIYGQGQDGFFMRFVCKPGSSPGHIKMHFTGHTAVSVQTNGSLRVESALEDLILAKPTAVFSNASGVESNASWDPEFVINLDGTVRISVGTVPSGSSLIIKTGREGGYGDDECDYYWSTYFGHTGNEVATGNDVDEDGFMYFTGQTTSGMFPVIVGTFQDQLRGNVDAYAACFRQLDEQEWATYYGGTDIAVIGGFSGDQGLAIKMNAQNNQVYFVGRTSAADFPKLQETGYFNNEVKVGDWSSRGFIVKLDAETGFRNWATFFGDKQKSNDAVTAMHIRENGNLVVGGHSFEFGNNQTSFPIFPTNNPGSMHIQTQGFVYVAEFNTSNAQVWATKLMNELNVGGLTPVLADIAEDTDGKLYVVGNINADGNNDFVPMGSNSRAFTGFGSEVYIFQFSQAKEIEWSSYLGGNSNEQANSIVCPQGGGMYITGTTFSSNFPTITSGDPGNPLLNDVSLDGESDIFISQFQNDDNGGNVLSWSRYLGGPGENFGFDSQSSIAHSTNDGAIGNATIAMGQNEIAITGAVEDNFSPLTQSSCPYHYGDINRGGNETGRDAILVIIKNRKITFSTYWGGDKPGGDSEDNGFTISKGISSDNRAFILLGGETNSREIAGQGITIPVCRELPFPGSYYNNNFLGGGADAFISKIYYGECLTSAVNSPWDQTWALEIQPNPATDAIYIKLPDLVNGDMTILLFDARGKAITNYSKPFSSAADLSVSVQIGMLPVGLYYVTMQSSGRTYSGKFIKM